MEKAYLLNDFQDDLQDKEFLDGLDLFEKKLYYRLLKETANDEGQWDEKAAQSVFEDAYIFHLDQESENLNDDILKEHGHNLTKEEFNQLEYYEEKEEIVKDILTKNGFSFIVIDDTDRRSRIVAMSFCEPRSCIGRLSS